LADPLTAGIAKELAPSLYADVKSWLVSLGKGLGRFVRNTSLREFNSPAELLEALESRSITEDSWIRLRCKPSPFGPFLRTHFITPIIGFNTEMRLGPRIHGENPILAMIAQTMSHLTPVGLYPRVSSETLQGVAYAADVEACGMIGALPGTANMTRSVPLLLAERHSRQFSIPSWLTAIIRRIDATSLGDAGFTVEDQEIIRQSGEVWFIDATHEDSRCYSIGEDIPTELWGGLYASGHLEIADGSLPIREWVEAFDGAMKSEGFATQVNQNKAGRREIAIYAKGARVTLDSARPAFSLHMDAELSTDFAKNRSRFDSLCSGALRNIETACQKSSVRLRNPLDVDFTYADAASAYSVLTSPGASAISDPLAVSIRNWHRRRNQSDSAPSNTR
jgi:hypothetical protein